jgi:hypothetical protein
MKSIFWAAEPRNNLESFLRRSLTTLESGRAAVYLLGILRMIRLSSV